MQIFRGVPRPAQRLPCALTVGNFDGVHRGHQALLARVTGAARARGLASAVMTFEPHPREFFAPQAAPMRISNLRDKLGALQAAGVDRVFIQHFNRRFAQLSAVDFVESILLAGCDVRWLLVGDDFRFGARRAGDNGLRKCTDSSLSRSRSAKSEAVASRMIIATAAPWRSGRWRSGLRLW